MKIILSITIVICFFGQGYAQFPVTQNMGSNATIVVSKGGLKGDSGVIVGGVTDSSAVLRAKSYAGALVRVGNTLYMRDSVAQKWLPFRSGSGSIEYVIGGTGILVDSAGRAYTVKADTGRATMQLVTGGTLGKVLDSLAGLIPTSFSYVDTIYRKAGQDSIFYTINGGTERGIKDSTGGADDSAFYHIESVDDTTAVWVRSDGTSDTLVIESDPVSSGGSVEYVVSGLGIKVDSSGRTYTVNSDTASATVLSRQRAAATYLTGSINDSRLLFSANGTVKDTSILSYDRANKRVGIGTASPVSQLHLFNNTSSLSQLTFENRTNTGYALMSFKSNNSPLREWQLVTYGSVSSATNAFDIVDASGGSVTRMRITAAGVGIGTTSISPSAQLDLTSTTRGLLLPRMTTVNRNAISSPTDGLMVFCTDCTATDGSTGVSQTYSSAAWRNHY